YELYGGSFGDDMRIPESGNDIPDILDEIRYEIEWLLKMQDPASGAVYSGVTVYEQGAGKGPASYVEPVDMEATKAFAAVLAKFSYLYQNYENAFATDCLKASDRAWKYVELNGEKEIKEADPWKFAAAAELYRASGLAACNRFITEYLRQTQAQRELDEVTFLGYVTYISTKQRVNLELCESITKELMQRAEEISEGARSSVYLVEEGEGNEHNLKLLENMMYLTMVDYMISNHEYDNVIENHLHYLMGRNEQAICYIDNEGENNYSQTDEALGIMKQFGANSKLIFMLSEIVGGHTK
ncbi:MAG: glycoside hydrolase family 9 protein, partial [Lachnospiraceae bacterium]|nr:glycoside hydrolase family 9 protein [Lachnospiraceae bacterium]